MIFFDKPSETALVLQIVLQGSQNLLTRDSKHPGHTRLLPIKNLEGRVLPDSETIASTWRCSNHGVQFGIFTPLVSISSMPPLPELSSEK